MSFYSQLVDSDGDGCYVSYGAYMKYPWFIIFVNLLSINVLSFDIPRVIATDDTYEDEACV